MQQLQIDFWSALPALHTHLDSALTRARQAGAECGERAVARAERIDPEFPERARAFILAHLASNGALSGEALTDAAKAAGIRPPDDRAFGPVFASLVRRNAIACSGFVPRSKGHGSAGGRLWRLVR